MTLSDAIMIYTNNRTASNAERAFKTIAKYTADEEANSHNMNDVERNQIEADVREDLENLYYKARENML